MRNIVVLISSLYPGRGCREEKVATPVTFSNFLQLCAPAILCFLLELETLTRQVSGAETYMQLVLGNEYEVMRRAAEEK